MAIYNKLTIGGSEVADNFNINVTKSQGDNDLSSNFSASIDNIDGRNSSNYNMGDNVIVYADQDVEIIPSAIPVNHYKLNDSAASTAVDDSGSAANDGVCDVNTSTISATGKLNNCLKLRSTDAKFDLTSNIDLTTGKTICFWVRPKVISNGYVDLNAYKNGYYPVGGHNVDTHDSCIDLQTSRIIIQDETGNGYNSSTGTAFVVGTWYHVAITFGVSATTFYLDGATNGTAAAFGSENLAIVSFGRAYSGITNGEADLDDVRVYNSTLTLNEIGALYNHGVGTEVESSSNQKIFDGILENIKFPSNVMDQKLNVTGRDYTARMMDRIVEPEIYTSLAAGSIVKDIIAKYADDITTTNVSDSATTISRIAFGNISVYDAVKQLAGLVESNYIFYVDDSKDLHFSAKSASSSGFTFDSGNTISADIREDRKNIYNEVWVYGDKYLDYFSESFTAGSPLGGSVFTLSYKPHSTEVTVDAAQQRGGIFGMNQVADSGTNYLVDFDSKKVVFVSGTTLGYDSIPASGAAVVTNYDRALSVIKVGQDSSSVASYGKRVKVVVDKAIKDPDAAQLRVERELSLLAEPEKEGNIKPKGFFNITPSETCVVNLPNQGVVSKTYDVLEVKYNFNKRDNITETNQSIKVNKKSKDFSDRVKDHELRLRKLEGADVLDADILPRFEFVAGSLSIRHSGLQVSTRSIAGDALIWGNATYGLWGTGKWRNSTNISFVLGNTQAGVLGTNTLGTQASAYTVVWSGGYF